MNVRELMKLLKSIDPEMKVMTFVPDNNLAS